MTFLSELGGKSRKKYFFPGKNIFSGRRTCTSLHKLSASGLVRLRKKYFFQVEKIFFLQTYLHFTYFTS